MINLGATLSSADVLDDNKASISSPTKDDPEAALVPSGSAATLSSEPPAIGSVEENIVPEDPSSSTPLETQTISPSDVLPIGLEEVKDVDEDEMMVVQKDEGEEIGPSEEDMDISMSDLEAQQNHEGKRVKVYELQDQSWFDRGTGHCKGVYDEAQELAMLIVIKEDEDPKPEGEAAAEPEGPGGFLKEELLLSSRVEKEDIYSRQQDTLIVWTEPGTNLDIALSFQDAEGCEDIWQFIAEVQKHLNLQPTEETIQLPSSSSPLSASPMLGMPGAMQGTTERRTWEIPNLGNIKEQEGLLRMHAKSPAGRERAVEHILSEDYIKNLISVFEQAEDLESLEDLHVLCSLMQTIILFNDNGILEYILQDDVFLGVIGIFEYDPDYPTLKASFRQFFQEIAKFRQVVDLGDDIVRQKIHQTYRLQFLKEVVLARLLDDPTFGILNGYIFFNQVDIIAHVQAHESILSEIFSKFRNNTSSSSSNLNKSPDLPIDPKKRDCVLFLHQLMSMGKSIQIPSRLALYRNLLEKGLLWVCEWAFSQPEATIVHPGAEMLTLMVDHDVVMVRNCILKEDESKKRTIIVEMVEMMTETKNLGIMSQMIDILRTLLDTGGADNEKSLFQKRETPSAETFVTYFYEQCFPLVMKPLLDMPDITSAKEPPVKLSREQSTLLQHLVELLSFCVTNHSHRASHFILSNRISRKTTSLLYLRDKPLRHASLRFVKACLKTGNHFIHLHFAKNDLLLPLLELLEGESSRDNMLSSACMTIFEIIRRENVKPVINYLFDKYRPRLETLSKKPFFRAKILGLESRWEQINEPPPAPPQIDSSVESSNKRRLVETEEEDYFNASDEEPAKPSITSTSTKGSPFLRRKRGNPVSASDTPPTKRPAKRLSTGSSSSSTGASSTGGKLNPSATITSLGLDYDDASDSDSSSGGTSPRLQPRGSTGSSETNTTDQPPITPPEELEGDLGEVALKMRAKRQREEEEEEGFAGLLLKSSTIAGSPSGNTRSSDTTVGGGTGTGTGSPSTIITINTKDRKNLGGNGGRLPSSPSPSSTTSALKDMGKKIKLSIGLGGKKIASASGGTGGGESPKSVTPTAGSSGDPPAS